MKNFTREQKAKLRDEPLYRNFEVRLDNSRMDDEKRIVEGASLSSEMPVARWFGTEVLEHSKEAIDLERAQGNGLAFLWSHNGSDYLGKIRNIRIENKRLIGDLHFAHCAKASEVWPDVRDGFLDHISIGYRINKWVESDEDDTITAIRWTLLEASIVTLPADISVGTDRGLLNKEENIVMTPEEIAEKEAKEKQERDAKDKINVVEIEAAGKKAREDGIKEGERIVQERIAAVRELFKGPRFDTQKMRVLKDKAITEAWDVEKTRSAMLDLVGEDNEALAPDAPTNPGSRFEGGANHFDQFRADMVEAVMCRGRGFKDEDGRIDYAKIREVQSKNILVNRDLEGMIREYCACVGLDVSRMNKEVLVSTAMNHRAGGLGNADLAAVVSDIIHKALQMPIPVETENWRLFTKVSALSDFKQNARINLSSMSKMKEVARGGASGIERGAIADYQEFLQARTFALEIALQYRTIRDDNIDALVAVPQEMRLQHSRLIGDLVWGILTGNPTLNQDSTALFHASHNNLITAGAAPSVATVDAMNASMATQRKASPDGVALGDPTNVRAAYMLVPHSLLGRSRVLSTSENDPDSIHVKNTVQGTFTPIPDARLDAFNPQGWFLAADPNILPTIEVAFLDGIETPQVLQESDWNTRGMKYAIWSDFDAGPMDFRGLQYNDGA